LGLFLLGEEESFLIRSTFLLPAVLDLSSFIVVSVTAIFRKS